MQPPLLSHKSNTALTSESQLQVVAASGTQIHSPKLESLTELAKLAFPATKEERAKAEERKIHRGAEVKKAAKKPAKKAPMKKAAAKKAPSKKAAKKAPMKKAAANKTTAKKAPAKRPAKKSVRR
jgi:hypothetical protein